MKKNNTAYSSSSTAYDFDLFLPKENPNVQPKKKDNVIALPINRNKRKAKPKVRLNINLHVNSYKLSRVFAATVIIGFAIAMIGMRAKVNEVQAKIDKANFIETQLLAEQNALNINLQQKESYATLADDAAALGMTKSDPSNVIYIPLNNKDKIIVSSKK